MIRLRACCEGAHRTLQREGRDPLPELLLGHKKPPVCGEGGGVHETSEVERVSVATVEHIDMDAD